MDTKHPIDTGNQPIIGNYTLNAQLPNNRQISIAGYFYAGESLASVNERLDFCQDAIDRQRARCEIPELEVAREQRIVAMSQMKAVMEELADKQRENKLSSNERLTLKNMQVNLKKMTEDIDKGEEAIAEAKRKAGVG